MNRMVAIAALGASLVLSQSAAKAVEVETFDDYFPDNVFGSWQSSATSTLNSGPTSFDVMATGYGSGYTDLVPNIDGTGADTVQLDVTVSAGVAGFLVDLQDTTGRYFSYAWFGLTPGGGVNGTNEYILTKNLATPYGQPGYPKGVSGPLDVANIDDFHIEVDPGQFATTPYSVSFNDLSLISTGAQNLTFNNTGGTGNGTSWDTTSQNFNNGTGPAIFHTGDNVTFNDTNNSHYNVTVTGVVAPGSTTVDTAGAYTFGGTGSIGGSGGLRVTGTGSLTINTKGNTYTGNTTVDPGASLTVNGDLPPSRLVNSGTVTFGANTGTGILVRTLAGLEINAGAKLTVNSAASSANRTVLVTGALDATTGPQMTGLLDLGANDLIVQGGSFSDIQTEVKTGVAGATGITSSAAGGTPKKALGYGAITAAGTFDGQPVAAGDVVVKYTLVGDASLDGSVNFSDLLAVAQNYTHTNTTWTTGDFNYDGTTNFADLLGLAQNYNKGLTLTGSQLSQLDNAGGATFAAAFAQAQAQSVVPEPTTFGVLGVGVLGMLARRRRSH